MSDRLAVSAAFSVLMMSAFVLFGPHATSSEFSPASLRAAAAPSGIAAPASISATGASLLSLD